MEAKSPLQDNRPTVVAVILAGRNPQETNPLAAFAQGQPKALIPIAGRPMIDYVVTALAHASPVETIVVVGLDSTGEISLSVPVEHVPDTGDLVSNAEAGVVHATSLHADAEAILVSTADIPLITSSMVEEFIAACQRSDHDVYYSIVERSVMEARFPGSMRSYVRLREGDFAGGDLAIVRPSLGLDQRALWQKLAGARKNALRQARLLGPGIFLRLLTGTLSLADAERRVGKVLNVRGKALPSTHAELAMDVDKPHQLEIARQEIERNRGVPTRR